MQHIFFYFVLQLRELLVFMELSFLLLASKTPVVYKDSRLVQHFITALNLHFKINGIIVPIS